MIFYMRMESWPWSSYTLSYLQHYLTPGLFGQPYNNEVYVNHLQALLMVLCRINDGHNPSLFYDDESTSSSNEESSAHLTPLEDLVVHWNSLVNMQSDEQLVDEGQMMTVVIKCEAGVHIQPP